MADVTREEFNDLYRTVNGNGVIGHKQRIAILEEESKNETCPTAKAFKTYLAEIKERKRFRTGDIANYISLAALIVLVIKEFLK